MSSDREGGPLKWAHVRGRMVLSETKVRQMDPLVKVWGMVCQEHHGLAQKCRHTIGMGTAWAMEQRGGQRKPYVWVEETIGPEGGTESLLLPLSPCPGTEEPQLYWTLVTHKRPSHTSSAANAGRLLCILPLYLPWSSPLSLALPPQRA